MEQMKNHNRTIDISAEGYGEATSLAMKDKSTVGDKLSIPSFQYKAPVSKLIYQNGVHTECDNNDGLTDKNSTLSRKAKLFAVKNIRLKALEQNCKKARFINIRDESSNIVFKQVCPQCRRILRNGENLASHFKVCRLRYLRRYIYACEKCTFITRNKDDLVSHKAEHAPIECPKCSLLCESKKSFIVHYHNVCKETRPEKKQIYTCELCAFSTNHTSALKTHRLLHPAISESFQLGRNISPPKEANDKIGQRVVVVTAKSLYAKEYDDVADAEPLPLRAQSNSVKQNSTIKSPDNQNIMDSLISTIRDHAYSKIDENSTNLIKHADLYRNKSSTSKVDCTNEGLNISVDKRIPSENSTNLNKNVDVYGKKSSTSTIVCTNEGLNLGIDKSILSENSTNSNENVDIYEEESSTSTIVYAIGGLNPGVDKRIACTNEGLNQGIDRRIASDSSENSDKHVDVYRKKSSTSTIVCANESLNQGADKRIASENPKNLDKHVNRKGSTSSSIASSNEGLNKVIDTNRRYKSKRRDKIIVRYCGKCKRTWEFGSYFDMRPLCSFCDIKLYLQCAQCDKVMTEYFEAIEHTEIECDKQDTLDTLMQVELFSERKSPRRTDSGSNLCTNRRPPLKDSEFVGFAVVDRREKIVRYCEKCKMSYDLACYSEQRPRCDNCNTKLQLKCIQCRKLMTEYFVAVEHTETCSQEEQIETEPCIANSSISDDRERDNNGTEKQMTFELTFEAAQKRVGRITYDIRSAKVTKICEKCNITKEFDVTNRCKTCYRNCTFQCNRCKQYFGNYQRVSEHLWTQCFKEGFYHCLKCTFKSPTKLIVRRHCEKDHPEFSDPLGSAKEADYIEYRAAQSNENSSWLPQNVSYQPKVPQPTKKSTKRVKKDRTVSAKYSRTCQHCITTFSTHSNFIKHLVHCIKPHVFACEDCPFTTKTKLDLDNHTLLYHSNSPSVNADSFAKSYPLKDSPPYKCRFCDHVAQRRAALQMHEGMVHLDELVEQELLVLEESSHRKIKIYECNACSLKIVNQLGDLRQHILKVHMNGQDASSLPPCARCGWDFQSCLGLKEHLAYCGKKLSMQCRVNLIKLNMQPAVLDDNIAETIKEETVDLGEFHMKIET